LILLSDFERTHPLRIDLVYAKAAHPHNIFKEAIYRKEARLWGHRLFVPVVLRAAEICHAKSKHIFELKDILRTVEAQEKIVSTALVSAHPEWLEEPRLFAPPGRGGHPRGMAVDVVLVNDNGDEVDMGTPFDYMTEDKKINPAARNFTDFGKGDAYNKEVLANRVLLESAMVEAARELSLPLLPLPQEWWDFRFPYDYTNTFAPVFDKDLPPNMRLTGD
jgi:D-alanyl-D-alanine dipeptidase